MRVLNLATCLPRQCGIATFSGDLRKALLAQDIDVGVIAISDQAETYAYPEECCFEIMHSQPEDYRMVAEYINSHDKAQLLIV
ncbi:MAG: glycosyl transferase family 1, partial [Syntrophomonadaceae bacterium]|nr:glycosyl transferase family 1 [Syntrophomonadaceae bacterium]